MTTAVDLPEKPSELIRLALRDLETVEANPHYEVNMASWHNAAVAGRGWK